jgi:hypothetical protein
MKIEMGESLVRSWLRHVKHCEFAELNWKPSPAWSAQPCEQVVALFDKAVREWPEAFGQNQLSQFLKQAEIDVLGFSAGNSQLHLVDIAFHSSGLNYGGQGKTGQRIYKKLVRSALIAKTYFPQCEAVVYFVTPVSSPGIKLEVEAACKRVSKVCSDDTNLSFRLVIGDDFKTELLDEVLALGSEVSDTSELFLRSWQLIKSFIELTPIANNYEELENLTVPVDHTNIINEVNRVAGKLQRWRNHQTQFNSRILNAYLSLKRLGSAQITTDMLRSEYGEMNFDSNFIQMRIISPNNHGKVFELNGDKVELWEPIEALVHDYEEYVFS